MLKNSRRQQRKNRRQQRINCIEGKCKSNGILSGTRRIEQRKFRIQSKAVWRKSMKIIHFTILERRGTLSQSPCNVNTSHRNLLQNPLSNKLMSHVLMKISLTAWYSTPSTDPDLIPSKSWPKISTRDSIWGTLLEEILMSYGRQIYAFISSRKPTTNCFNSATTVAIELFDETLLDPSPPIK